MSSWTAINILIQSSGFDISDFKDELYPFVLSNLGEWGGVLDAADNRAKS